MKTVRRVITFCTAVAVVMAIAPVAKTFAADGDAKDVVLTGEPVDMNCYLDGKSGPGHAGCATACANKGNPIGLLVADGDNKVLYLVLGDGGKSSKDLLAAHMGAQVNVTGKASNKEGMRILLASKVDTGGSKATSAGASDSAKPKITAPKVKVGN